MAVGLATRASAQRVEHYEMAGFGTVQTFAKLLAACSYRSFASSSLQRLTLLVLVS